MDEKIETNKNENTEDNYPSFNKRQFWTYQRFYEKGGGKKTKQVKPPSKNITDKTKKRIYHIVDNKVVNNPELRSRLDSIYIPPGYSDIVIAKSAKNKIQAIGTDTKGRRQYIYNDKYTKKRNDRKYNFILGLAKKINQIEKDNNAAINTLYNKEYSSWKLPNDYYPIIVYMLRTYHFRIGNEKYTRENDSYGITTLKKEHIKFGKGDGEPKITIEFIGKKGVMNNVEDDNTKIASILRILCDHADSEGFLFNYNHNGVKQLLTPGHVHSYLNERYHEDISPKMFRTWYANIHLLNHLQNMLKEEKLKYRMTKSEIKDIVSQCSEHVSSKLNNTANVSKKSYIDNKLLDVIARNPYRFAQKIPENDEEKNKFLYKILINLRN
jgi:DNA topoisomerase-1